MFGGVSLIIILTIILYNLGKKNPFIIKNKYIVFVICCLITQIVQVLLINIRNDNIDSTDSTIYKISQFILMLLYASTITSALIAFFRPMK